MEIPKMSHQELNKYIENREMPSRFHNLPCATSNFISYRAKCISGFIMIGANNDDDALREAKRSYPNTRKEELEKWNGTEYILVK